MRPAAPHAIIRREKYFGPKSWCLAFFCPVVLPYIVFRPVDTRLILAQEGNGAPGSWEKYCGLKSWCLAVNCGFPCIAFCPIDTKPASDPSVRTEKYCGPRSCFICMCSSHCVMYCPIDERQVPIVDEEACLTDETAVAGQTIQHPIAPMASQRIPSQLAMSGQQVQEERVSEGTRKSDTGFQMPLGIPSTVFLPDNANQQMQESRASSASVTASTSTTGGAAGVTEQPQQQPHQREEGDRGPNCHKIPTVPSSSAVHTISLQECRIDFKTTHFTKQTVVLTRGENGGVGLMLQRPAQASSGPFMVTKIVPGSPADLCKRMQPGDHLEAVDDVLVHELNRDQVTSLIKGIAGSVVTLTLLCCVSDEQSAEDTISGLRMAEQPQETQERGEKGCMKTTPVPLLRVKKYVRPTLQGRREEENHSSAASVVESGWDIERPVNVSSDEQLQQAVRLQGGEAQMLSELFLKATEGQDKMYGSVAREIFARSGLSFSLLRNIWKVCDRGSKGYLTMWEFALAFRLIQLAQADMQPTLHELTRLTNEQLQAAISNAPQFQSGELASPGEQSQELQGQKISGAADAPTIPLPPMEDGAVDTGTVQLQSGDFDDMVDGDDAMVDRDDLDSPLSKLDPSTLAYTCPRAMQLPDKEAQPPSFDGDMKFDEEVQQYVNQYNISSQAQQALHEMGVSSLPDLLYLEDSDLTSLKLVDQGNISRLRDDIKGKTIQTHPMPATLSAYVVTGNPDIEIVALPPVQTFDAFPIPRTPPSGDRVRQSQ